MKNKVIISAALSGAAPIREANPNVPHTTEEYLREAKRAEDAGAAIVHIHFREPDTGNPTTDPAIMKEVVEAIQELLTLHALPLATRNPEAGKRNMAACPTAKGWTTPRFVSLRARINDGDVWKKRPSRGLLPEAGSPLQASLLTL